MLAGPGPCSCPLVFPRGSDSGSAGVKVARSLRAARQPQRAGGRGGQGCLLLQQSRELPATLKHLVVAAEAGCVAVLLAPGKGLSAFLGWGNAPCAEGSRSS